MRLVLDTRNMHSNGGTGISTYAQTLANARSSLGRPVSWLTSATVGESSLLSSLSRFGRSLRGHRNVLTSARDYEVGDLYRTAVSRYRTFAKITMLESDSPPDVMHWTCPLPLHWKGCANVITIHDLVPLLHPELSITAFGNVRSFLQACCDRAQGIVTISDAVRSDILTHLRVCPKKVVNLSQAVEFDHPLLSAASSVEAVCPDDGFLYFGLLERRKNLSRLIKAHGLSRSRRPLTLIGTLGNGGEEIVRERQMHPAPELVRIVPWVRREALIGAIQRARAVVFPSLAEGFGLPIIEAMLLGTPVMTSLGHATEETAGGAALLVDPHDAEGILVALKNLDENDELVEELKILGRQRAADFSLSAYGARLSEFYDGFSAL